jgi:hypothetical protein
LVEKTILKRRPKSTTEKDTYLKKSEKHGTELSILLEKSFKTDDCDPLDMLSVSQLEQILFGSGLGIEKARKLGLMKLQEGEV